LKDTSLQAVVVESKDAGAVEIIGYSFIATPWQMKVMDMEEQMDVTHDRYIWEFIDMWNGETIEQWVYVVMRDIYEVSTKAVYNKMEYLFNCYLTRRFYFQLMNQLNLEDTYTYQIIDGAT
jgi:hypothetical protein